MVVDRSQQEGVAIPLIARLHLGRAAVQTLANDHGVDILHLKGDAFDRTLRSATGPGTDIDVLVRPRHVQLLDAALVNHGWAVHSTFRGGSPFAHARTYQHDMWVLLDLHRRFPGIGSDSAGAFSHLWSGRGSRKFGGVECAVPSPSAQMAILVLNAARSGPHAIIGARHAWVGLGEAGRAGVEREISALDAQLAFDAGLGRVERHRGDREYRLWKAVSQGGGRIEEWWGRVVAARGPRSTLLVVLRAPLVNIEHLRHRLGRTPSASDVVAEFFARPVRGVLEAVDARRGGRGR